MSLHSGQSSIPSEAHSHSSAAGDQLPLDMIERLIQQVEDMNKTLKEQSHEFGAQIEKDDAIRAEVARYVPPINAADANLQSLSKTFNFETDHFTKAVTNSFNELASTMNGNALATAGMHRELLAKLQKALPMK
ncbi:unnamed protein product [Peniophora sp. CBMAI 1063]|nr:unnamed protein product [Peniophora sp. CBMAI 1063]